MAEYDMSAIPCKNPAMFGAKSTSKGIVAADWKICDFYTYK